MKQSDLRALAAHLMNEFAPHIKVLVSESLAAAGVNAGTPIIPVVHTLKVFEDANPGIGGAPPELPACVERDAETGEETPTDLTLEHVWAFCKVLSDKLDALTQATGHGNSAAMAPHL